MNIAVKPVKEERTGVHFVFRSPALEAELAPLCKRALSRFQRLPAYKLLCYIDDEFPGYLPATDCVPAAHRAFSGLHVPIRGGGKWPDYVQKWLFTRDHEFAFDNLIYIPRTEYARESITFVLILAHELQHFVQYGESELGRKVSRILFDHLRKCDAAAMAWVVPDERDAMIVSKRVTEEEFGARAVRHLMERQIADAGTKRDFAKKDMWSFLNSLSSMAVYDWRRETGHVIEKYRSCLEATLRGEEMSLVNTWLLPKIQ